MGHVSRARPSGGAQTQAWRRTRSVWVVSNSGVPLSLEIARKEGDGAGRQLHRLRQDMTDVPEVKSAWRGAATGGGGHPRRVAHPRSRPKSCRRPWITTWQRGVSMAGSTARLGQARSYPGSGRHDPRCSVDWPGRPGRGGRAEKVDECERELNALLSANAQRAMRQRAMRDWERRMEAVDSAVQIAQRQLEESGTDANVPALQAEALKARQAFEVRARRPRGAGAAQ